MGEKNNNLLCKGEMMTDVIYNIICILFIFVIGVFCGASLENKSRSKDDLSELDLDHNENQVG